MGYSFLTPALEIQITTSATTHHPTHSDNKEKKKLNKNIPDADVQRISLTSDFAVIN